MKWRMEVTARDPDCGILTTFGIDIDDPAFTDPEKVKRILDRTLDLSWLVGEFTIEHRRGPFTVPDPTPERREEAKP